MTRFDDMPLPPHSIDSEQAVLGALMLDERAFTRVSDWLEEGDFYRKDHQLIYRAISELADRNMPFDSVTLADWFESNNLSELVGSSSYVIELSNTTPSAANIAAYAEIVREKSKLRKLIDTGQRLVANALRQTGTDSNNIATAAAAEIAALGAASRGGLALAKSSVGAWFAELGARFDRHEEYTGVLTPWANLNDLTLGLQPGDLIIIAGRSNMGKSVTGFQIALHNALAGARTSVHSLEMRDKQVIQRGIAAFGGISHRALQRPRDLDDADWARVTGMTTRLAASPLLIDDQAGITAAQVAARAKQAHLRAPLTLSVIDHLHAVRRPGRDPVNELGDVAQTFKNLAKELNIPIVLLAQLNRANTARTDHRPTMADLRGSGSIEEIADVILLLHREDYYDRKTHLKGVVEMIVGKGRDIETGGTLYFRNHYDQMRIEQWEGPLPEPTGSDEKAKKATGFKKTVTKADDYRSAKEGE